MVNGIKKEFFEEIKNYLSKEEYGLYIKSLGDKDRHGMTLNLSKLKKSSIDLNYIIDRFKAKLIYENDKFAYLVYDKEQLSSDCISPGKDPLHHAGLYYIQEPNAAEVMYDVDIKENFKVLDICASPGGKSAEILYMLDKTKGGFLVSNEVDYKRSKVLSSNIERLGFDNVAITCEKSKNLSNSFIEYFDVVVVDAPCSGEGMFRKSEEARLQWNKALVKSCAEIQKGLIEDAYNMLKSGGTLVYSTCTFSKEEDENIVDYIREKHSDLSLVKMKKLWPFNSIGEGQFYAILKKGESNTANCMRKVSIKMFDEINLLRYGAELYEFNKKDQIPTHAATHLDDFKFDNEVDLNDEEINKYLKGETIRKELGFAGYCKITYKGLGIGLAKYSNGILKNHYPKGLRNY